MDDVDLGTASRSAPAPAARGIARAARGVLRAVSRPAAAPRRLAVCLAAAALAIWAPAAEGFQPAEQPLSSEQVAAMSLEELMALPVTSVAGVERDWFNTPAAIAVISGEDVRRSGFRTLAEALRLSPGTFVGQTNSHAFSVGMRGFNGSLANKTLVLIDGRAVYDPLSGGTFWDVQDVMLEDLDRIEVIRGPGATLWGANAVNGVVNVITKSAKETQGALVTAGGGTYERAFAEARYGLKVGEASWLRVYGKWFQRDHLVDSAGQSTQDDWSMTRGGFRFDREGAGGGFATVQGDVYGSGDIGELIVGAPVPGQNIQFVNDVRNVKSRGGNLLARIGQEQGDRGWSLQAYYDRTERTTFVTFEVERDTFAVDWWHHFKSGERHDIMWGLGARYTSDRTRDGFNLVLNPRDADATTLSAFVQDTITLAPDRLFAMVGSKFSHNDYTGFEVQPSARLWWTPDDRQTLWASVSRAVRIPSRAEEQGMIVFGYIDTGTLVGAPPTGTIIPLGIQANSHLKSEELIAYEAGYRVRPAEGLTIDAAAFYNDYERLIYVPSVVERWNNNGFGETYGGEIAVKWRAADNWRLEGSYSYVDVQIHGPVLPADEDNSPHHQAQLHSYLNITPELELNSSLYFVDRVPQAGASAYTRLDLGVTWRPSPNVELSVWGQNLLEPHHREFSPNLIQRGVYFMGTVSF